MNKQLTKKTIGIAASAALMASVAFSGSALAAPGNKGGNKQGPQASLDVFTVCNIDADADQLIVDVTITDPNAGTDKAAAVLETVNVQGLQKAGGKGKGSNTWMTGADSWSGATDLCDDGSMIGIGTTCTIKLNLCGTLGASKAVNAETAVTISGLIDGNVVDSSKTEYTSLCKDDPYTLEVNEADLKVADYPGLCE